MAETHLRADSARATPAPSLAQLDFTRLDDHSCSLDLIQTLIDVAIDEIPPTESSCANASNLLFAALRIVRQERETFGQIHTDLFDIKRASAAAPAEHHMSWLIEYERVRSAIDNPATREDTPEYEALCKRMNELEGQVLSTPASSRDAVTAKMFMALRCAADGSAVANDDAVPMVEEAQSALGLNPTGEC